MSEFASDPQDVAEQFDDEMTGADDEDALDVAASGSEHLVVDGEDIVSTAADRAPEEAAVHVVDDPRD